MTTFYLKETGCLTSIHLLQKANRFDSFGGMIVLNILLQESKCYNTCVSWVIYHQQDRMHLCFHNFYKSCSHQTVDLLSPLDSSLLACVPLEKHQPAVHTI